jgi:hypothetical protein
MWTDSKMETAGSPVSAMVISTYSRWIIASSRRSAIFFGSRFLPAVAERLPWPGPIFAAVSSIKPAAAGCWAPLPSRRLGAAAAALARRRCARAACCSSAGSCTGGISEAVAADVCREAPSSSSALLEMPTCLAGGSLSGRFHPQYLVTGAGAT